METVEKQTMTLNRPLSAAARPDSPRLILDFLTFCKADISGGT